MNSLVNFAFDTVAWLSSWLALVLEVIARGDSDAMAGIVTGCCLLVILGCYSLAAEGASFLSVLRRVFAPIGVLLVLSLVICKLGTKVTSIKTAKLHRSEGHAWKTKLDGSLTAALGSSRWWLVSSDSGIGSSKYFLRDAGMKRTTTISNVKNKGGGLYFLRDGVLWISRRAESTSEEAGPAFSIALEKKWAGWARGVLAWGFAVGSLLIFLLRTLPCAARFLAVKARDPLFAVPLLLFVLFFGWHQARFIEQDGRMQLVTSRDDDGYMFGRLVEAARQKTMDPWKLGNSAYGAIGFYPFALPSFIAGHLGIEPSIAALNISTRGQKLLISALMLAAVWFLAARHFGRWPAVGAVMLTATHEGFLSYSSYPFYPDVLMAMLAVLSLAFILDLAQGWSGRSFILATAFAGMSVSIKFLTFLLFPLIAIVAVVSLRRHAKSLPAAPTARIAVTSFGAAAVLGVAIFFLCNPYLDYNIGWVVPNYKMCSSYYSSESPNVVGDGAATWADWKKICYGTRAQVTDLFVAVLSVLLAALCPARSRAKAVLLLLFAFGLQAYVLRSITLRSAIDTRLLLPGLPCLYVAAAAGVAGVVVFAMRLWRNAQAPAAALSPSSLRLILIMTATCLAAASIMMPRLAYCVSFMRDFGRFPQQSAVSDWLRKADLADNSRIVTSLQSYFPPQYRRVLDGLWTPDAIIPLLCDNDDAAPVFIEEESYREAFFSEAAGATSGLTETQTRLFDSGRQFYRDLRGGRMIPFAPVANGEEIVATNFAPGPGTLARFHAYANLHHEAPDLTLRGETSSVSDGLPFVRWETPVLVSLVHVTTSRPQEAGSVKFEVWDSLGQREVFDAQCPEQRWCKPSNFYLQLQPPKMVGSLHVVSSNGSAADSKLTKSLHAFAPAPVMMNPTGYHFDLVGSDADSGELGTLVANRFDSKSGVEIPPGRSCKFTLEKKRPAMLEAIWLTLADAPSDPSGCRCTFTLTSGKRIIVKAAAHELTGSNKFALHFSPGDSALVTTAQIEVSNTASIPNAPPRSLVLRQVYAVAHDVQGALD